MLAAVFLPRKFPSNVRLNISKAARSRGPQTKGGRKHSLAPRRPVLKIGECIPPSWSAIAGMAFDIRRPTIAANVGAIAFALPLLKRSVMAGFASGNYLAAIEQFEVSFVGNDMMAGLGGIEVTNLTDRVCFPMKH